MSGDTRVKGSSKLRNRTRKRALMHELEKQEYQQEQKLLSNESDGGVPASSSSSTSSRASLATNKKVVL